MALFTTGAILGGLGLGAKLYGQHQASQAIDRNVSNAIQQQEMTQDRLDQERQQKVSEAMEELAVGKEQTQQAQDERIGEMLQRFEQNQAGGGGGSDPAPATPDGDNPAGKAFSSTADKLAEQRSADNTQRRESMAELDSLGDVFSENNLALQPAQTEINLNRRTAQEEAQRLPLEVQVATQKGAEKGKNLRRAGDLSMTVGTGMMAGGSSGPWANFFGGQSAAQGARTASSWSSNHPTAGR